MIKNILAVAIVVALSACSSDDDDNNDTPTTDTGTTTEAGAEAGGETPVTTTPVVTDGPVGGGEGPVTDTKAGSYFGSFGDGGDGVYVINNDNELAGLRIFADGSAQSLFGSVGAGDTFSGDLRQHIHQESRPDATESFGSIGGTADPLSIDVTIVNGQTIESTAESATAVSLLGTTGSSVEPANAASVAGTWIGNHGFCADAEDGTLINCNVLTTTLTFDGVQVTGTTNVTDPDGNEGSAVIIEGGITEFGDALTIEFNWGDASGYSGVVFFTPSGDGRLVFIGENAALDNPTISAVMTRQ